MAKTPTVAVVGLGYVGLPTAIAMAHAGIKVVGVDVNRSRVNSLNGGKSFIAEIPDTEIVRIQKKFRATTDWKLLRICNVILISVPTPITKHHTPDTSSIEAAAKKIARYLKRGQLVVLESTTYPGTTEELLMPILETSGLSAGKDFFLAFAPERIDPGNKNYRLEDIPKVVGGINRKSTQLAVSFYKKFLRSVHPVSSPKTAEMAKLLENIYRLVNISLVNELKMIADKMGIDFWEVIEAAKTKPYGFTPFYPGPGVGGHCIPVDPFYLSWKAREYNFFARFIDLAAEINELMPHHVVTKVIWALNQQKKSLRGSKILVLGVAYKKDIDDPRESPAIPIINDLLRKGADVVYNDPHISSIAVHEKILFSSPLSKSLVHNADCVVIITDHSAYDYEMIGAVSRLVVDTRNSIKKKAPNILN